MPELPEAETVARELARHLVGRRLTRVRVLRQDVVHGDGRPFAQAVAGRAVLNVGRRGKRVVLELAPRGSLVFHMGMSGRVSVCAARGRVAPHTHLRMGIGGTREEVRFVDPRRFGGVWFVDDGVEPVCRPLRELGLEPLTLTAARFRRVLQRRRQLKALLMDQYVVAGLGNIYCDESLHAARLHPLTRADTLDAAAAGRLLRAIKATLRRAIQYNGSTLMDYRQPNGQPGGFQRLHRVYQREGQPCRACGALVVRALVAGRSTFFCPRCQKKETSKRRIAEGTVARREGCRGRGFEVCCSAAERGWS